MVAALVPVIAGLAEQITALEATLTDRFEQHPDAGLLLALPGLGHILGARVLAEFGDAPDRYADAKARRNYAGTAPITRASGTSEVVLARLARNTRLFDACYQWAFCALTASPGARAHYDAHNPGPRTAKTARRKLSPTNSSASSTAPSPTTPATTNSAPGTTGCPPTPNSMTSPLDTFQPWGV